MEGGRDSLPTPTAHSVAFFRLNETLHLRDTVALLSRTARALRATKFDARSTLSGSRIGPTLQRGKCGRPAGLQLLSPDRACKLAAPAHPPHAPSSGTPRPVTTLSPGACLHSRDGRASPASWLPLPLPRAWAQGNRIPVGLPATPLTFATEDRRAAQAHMGSSPTERFIDKFPTIRF